jgi:lipopolysaccharide biosynthesis glycosyltransferase
MKSIQVAAFVFAIDKNFVLPLKVLLSSLVNTHSTLNRESIFLLHDRTLGADEQNDLITFCARYSLAITFIDITSRLELLPSLRDGSHVTYLTYARLFLASVLPPEIQTAIYIDADTLCIQNVSDLFEFSLHRPIAACDHCSPFDQLRVHGPCGGSYFQAGMVRVDIALWRNLDIEHEFNAILVESSNRILWWDQDVLNIAFKDNWQRIPVSYNFCRVVRNSLVNPQHSVSISPKIIHFDGGDRPWDISRTDSYGLLWYAAYYDSFQEYHPLDPSFDKRVQPPSFKSSTVSILRSLKSKLIQRKLD